MNDLCKVFNVEGKVQDYNMDWNDITILDSPTNLELLLTYARQDSVILLKALTKAQQEFISKYGVDIVDVLSLPSLALKIFRLKYLKINLPVLNRINDDYIRRSYFGGAVDIYRAKAEDAYYYDMNSLYPAAMLDKLPVRLIETINNPEVSDFFHDDCNFFGFMDVDIECPDHIGKPVLPYKYENRTIFPQGIFTGVYFSEELRECVKLGYKIHSAKRFSLRSLAE